MRFSLTFPALVTVLAVLLTVSPAVAAPSLAVQGAASYHVTGTFKTTSNCTSTNATIGGIACGQSQNQSFSSVSALDDGRCAIAGDKNCQFSPSSATVVVGGTVHWNNLGNFTGRDRINHTATSDTGLFNFDLPATNFTRPPNFCIASSFPACFIGPSFTFSKPGTYLYHCTIHSWMTGKVDVVLPAIPPPKVDTKSLSGSIGWSVLDLDDNALLKVSHDISVFNSTSDQATKIYSDSASSEQTIELSTRKDSPALFSPFPFLYGFGILYQGIAPGPVGIYPYPQYAYGYQIPESYTIWWVNGPLTATSTIELLSSHAGVRGSESLNLGSSVGTQDSWIVATEFNHASNQSAPFLQFGGPYCNYYRPYPYNDPFIQPIIPQCISAQNVTQSLKLDYGKQSDLLFALSSDTEFSSQSTNVYPPGSFVYPQYGGGGIVISSQTSVVRTSTTSFTLSLKLDSTNLDLSKRVVPPPASSSGPTPANASAQSSTPMWVYGTIGVIATLIVGAGVWGTLRLRHKPGAPDIGTGHVPAIQSG